SERIGKLVAGRSASVRRGGSGSRGLPGDDPAPGGREACPGGPGMGLCRSRPGATIAREPTEVWRAPHAEEKVGSVSELAVKVSQDPQLQAAIKENPAAVIASLAAPLQTDVWIYRMVVGALGLAVLIAVVGAIVLAVYGKAIPDVLTALG